MFSTLDVSTSALVAQRTRMDLIAGNIANADATVRADGTPGGFRRQFAILAPGDGRGGSGVHVESIREDPSPGRLVYDPDHPHAMRSGPKQGFVESSNVELSTEMVNGMLASRAYEANISAMDVTKRMIASTFRLLA